MNTLRVRHWFILVMFSFMLIACSSNSPQAPIINGWHEPISKQGTYTVRTGDTLYSIAWRYGLEYHDIARINHLPAPAYTVKVGQVLYLVPPDKKTAAKPVAAKPVATKPASAKPVAATPAKASTTASKPVAAKSTTTQSTPAAKPVATTTAAKTTSGGVTWQWPADGKIVQGFNANSLQSKGVDIANSAGTPIKAAAAGQVVYSGSGLPGYGYLIIIKHNDTYLSAYAHNSSVLVKEGQRVKAGQVIAKMGNTGADRVMLHFEVRRRGQPIDPQTVLPRR